MQKYKVIGEKFSDPELGEVVKDGKKVTFTLSFDTEGFSNMQEVKDYLRKHKKKMNNIVRRYMELTMMAKYTEGMFEKKEHPVIAAVMKKLGYL